MAKPVVLPSPKKNPYAVAMGRKGGLAKVPKGFAKMDKRKFKVVHAKAMAAKAERRRADTKRLGLGKV